jgi:thiol:disulfide interchange protein
VVILGAVDLIRAQEIAESIPNYLGILVLLEGVVMLQNAVQLKNLRGKLWVISLLFSLVSVAASIVILLDVQHIISNQVEVLYIILICVGAFALLSLCLVGSRTRKYHKEFHREQERQMQESEEWFQGVAAAKQETKTLEEVTEQEETAEEKTEEIEESEESDSQEG